MARSTGPILAIGAITMANQSLFSKDTIPVDFRVPIATGIAAGAFAIVEKANEQIAVGIAWAAFITLLLVRMDPAMPAPVETLSMWWNSGNRTVTKGGSA